MGKLDKAPKRRKPARYTVEDFELEFPTEDACLEWLKAYLYPHGVHCENCKTITKHHRVARRRSYSCQHCGRHVHPTAGTIFHKSTTSLRTWFYAIYLMALTDSAISPKVLQRATGVAYKTALRMRKQIRAMLDDPNTA